MRNESRDHLLNKLKQSEKDIDRLKSLLQESQASTHLLTQRSVDWNSKNVRAPKAVDSVHHKSQYKRKTKNNRNS